MAAKDYSFEPDDFALMVVDLVPPMTTPAAPLTAFASKHEASLDGYLERLRATTIPNAARLVTRFRAQGSHIIWTRPLVGTPARTGWPTGLVPMLESVPASALATVDDWSLAEGLSGEPSDYFITKRGISAFWNGNADALLRNLGVRHLLLTGCLTNYGVLINAIDAAQRGFQVTIVADACAALSDWEHTGALTIHPYRYDVLGTDDALDRLDTRSWVGGSAS